MPATQEQDPVPAVLDDLFPSQGNTEQEEAEEVIVTAT